jgi:hypothetical protein
MADDPVRDAQEQVNAALDARRRAYANSPTNRSRWGDGLESQRLSDYRVVVMEHTRHGDKKRHTFVLDPDTEGEPGGPHWRRFSEKPPNGGGPQQWGAARYPLPDIISLARGMDISASSLVVILEALVSGSKHQIDLAHIKTIVSQLGSRLTTLTTLDEQTRRLAESALYTEILARCSTM